MFVIAQCWDNERGCEHSAKEVGMGMVASFHNDRGQDTHCDIACDHVDEEKAEDKAAPFDGIQPTTINKFIEENVGGMADSSGRLWVSDQ
jgi:hypothetical protein